MFSDDSGCVFFLFLFLSVMLPDEYDDDDEDEDESPEAVASKASDDARRWREDARSIVGMDGP